MENTEGTLNKELIIICMLSVICYQLWLVLTDGGLRIACHLNQTCVIVMLVQARPGYWHQAAAATLPRNCLLDLVKLCCSDTGDTEGDTVQRTVLRFTVTSPARAEPAEEVVLETHSIVRSSRRL